MNGNRTSYLYATDLDTAVWRKASASGGEGNCVEVAAFAHGAARAVRDSKDLGREPLRFTTAGWAAFQAGIVAGDL